VRAYTRVSSNPSVPEKEFAVAVGAELGAATPRGLDAVGYPLPERASVLYVALGAPSPVKNVHSDVSPAI